MSAIILRYELIRVMSLHLRIFFHPDVFYNSEFMKCLQKSNKCCDMTYDLLGFIFQKAILKVFCILKK